MFSFVFYIFYELFDSYDATRVSYRRFVGKTGREETGNTEKRGAFRYVVAMETGNTQYLSNIEETYDFKILKGTDPEIVKVSGGKAYLFFKRAFDIVFAIVVGLVLLFLFMPIIAIAIKLDSKGPVLFKQERLGKDEKPFMMYKFRSMYIDAEKDGPQWAIASDQRATRVGRFLRKTRIDELPQMWNILVGDMSLVGPRPEREFFYLEFERDIPNFRDRLAVKPGLTGLAQVNGGYELDPQSKLDYDIEYMGSRSILLDIKCILKTVKLVFTHDGAR